MKTAEQRKTAIAKLEAKLINAKEEDRIETLKEKWSEKIDQFTGTYWIIDGDNWFKILQIRDIVDEGQFFCVTIEKKWEDTGMQYFKSQPTITIRETLIDVRENQFLIGYEQANEERWRAIVGTIHIATKTYI